MTSSAFDKFTKQLDAQGREKGDGFDASHFDGMNENERTEARRRLENALAKGDSTAAFGLVLLDGAAAEESLHRTLTRLEYPNDTGADVAGELWKLTGKSEYRRVLVHYLQHPKHLVRQTTIVHLGSRACEATDDLGDALDEMVMSEPNETVQFLAVKLLLYCRGLISGIYDKQHSYKELVNDLTSENLADRRKALDDFV